VTKLSVRQIIIFSISILVLFSIPIYTITANSSTLKDGTEYMFKVTGLDPYDMFRGNYLNIRFKENTVRHASLLPQNKEYYVTIEKHPDGFAYFKDISTSKPVNTADYFKTKAYYSLQNEYRIDTPTRYYMNERKSLRAEEVFMGNLDNASVKVRVKNGRMVIVGVYVNGVLIDTID